MHSPISGHPEAARIRLAGNSVAFCCCHRQCGRNRPAAVLPHSSHFHPGSKGRATTQLHTSGTLVSTPSSAAAGGCSFKRLAILKYLVHIQPFRLFKKKPIDALPSEQRRQSHLLTCCPKGFKTRRWKHMHVQFLIFGQGRVWTSSWCLPRPSLWKLSLIQPYRNRYTTSVILELFLSCCQSLL